MKERVPSIETIDLEGTITWIESNNNSSHRPITLDVNLYRNGQLFLTQTVEANSNINYPFPNLLKYDENYNEYVYLVQLDSIPDGYELKQKGNSFTLVYIEDEVIKPDSSPIDNGPVISEIMDSTKLP